MSDPEETCLFCRIGRGEIPADLVHEDDLVLAFRDINPKAPTHLLLIPRRHIESAAVLGEADAEVLGRLFTVAAKLAREAGLTGSSSGFRITTNSGAAAGQSVFHLHFHLMGGRSMGWPPG